MHPDVEGILPFAVAACILLPIVFTIFGVRRMMKARGTDGFRAVVLAEAAKLIFLYRLTFVILLVTASIYFDTAG